MPFLFKKLDLPEVVLVEARSFPDERGKFLEMYKKSDFARAGIKAEFVQDSISISKKNVLRGLHFQKPPHVQAKLIGVVAGKILDVAVDMRKSFPNFGKWVAQELSDENAKMLYIPEGFAHGFLVLSEEARVCYKMSKEYAPGSDGGVIWNDLKLNISWPVDNPILSEKDSKLPSFENAFYFE